ncbi:hypothetical protein [Aquimarina litoralis]|uniref:hypothetical protein n=1 Tax=Aquimarina litoralis TaxID=584605 RepID=UPI001C5925BA|nr:hypothetical protein [Aquimarina litoralis]MBW1297141.1 hypothetical protein [Aquimarina litoralis]
MNILISNRYRGYVDITLGLIVLYGILYHYTALITLITDSYYPVKSDEFLYFINTESYILNDTLRAALTFTGNGSPVFGTDSHGFGYPLMHGFIGEVFGWGHLNFIYFNFIIVLVAIFFIAIMRSISLNQKLWITCIILLFPFFPIFSFTYMQEIIHVFIGILMSILLYNIYKKNDNIIYISIFIGITIAAGFFRLLWLFWLIGLIPLAKTKPEFVKYGLIFVFGVILSFVFVKLFAEPVSNYFTSVINLLTKGEIIEAISSVVNHFFKNLRLYFFEDDVTIIYTSIKYINFGLVAYFSFDAIKDRNRLSMAIALIGIINFLLLFFLYDAFAWREIRTLSPLFYFHVIFIVLKLNNIGKYVLVTGLCCLFFLTLKTSNRVISERNSVDVQNLNKQKKIYSEIAEKVPDNSTILLAYLPQDFSLDLLSLPLRNTNNSPIRYIVQYQKVKIGKYDYILSRPGANVPNKKVIENNLYALFEKK